MCSFYFIVNSDVYVGKMVVKCASLFVNPSSLFRLCQFTGSCLEKHRDTEPNDSPSTKSDSSKLDPNSMFFPQNLLYTWLKRKNLHFRIVPLPVDVFFDDNNVSVSICLKVDQTFVSTAGSICKWTHNLFKGILWGLKNANEGYVKSQIHLTGKLDNIHIE